MGERKIHFYKGELMSISELMPFCVVEKKLLMSRLNRGWSAENATSKPKGEWQDEATKRSVDANIAKGRRKKIYLFARCVGSRNSK